MKKYTYVLKSVNADINAAINISRAAVNQPIVATRNSALQAPSL